MKGLFWNSRGLSDLAKTKILRGFIQRAEFRLYCSYGNGEERFFT
jgi:hypothetical protein